MDSFTVPSVFRLRQVPAYVTSHDVAAQLLSAGLGDICASDIKICSLATVLSNPWTGACSRTATVMFYKIPSIVNTRREEFEVMLKIDGLDNSLILDNHFRGLTPLYDILPPHKQSIQ
jgi:hypothetical protein